MSEEVNINTKHLTTTEDEFENFQANYEEEEEYITLSDLVSPQDDVNVVLPGSVLENSDLGENLPYEQNVVYDDVGLSADNIEIAAEIDRNSLLHHNETNQHTENSESISFIRNCSQDPAVSKLKTKGRGRKCKSEFNIRTVSTAKYVSKRGRGRGRGGLQGRGRGGLRGRGRGGSRGRGKKKSNFESLMKADDSPSSSSNESLTKNRPHITSQKSKRGRKNFDKAKSEETSSQLDLDKADDVTSTMNDLGKDKRSHRGRSKTSIEHVTPTSVNESKNCNDSPKNNVKVNKQNKKRRKAKSRHNTYEKELMTSEINVDNDSIEAETLINQDENIDLQNDIIDSSSKNSKIDEENDYDNICLSTLKSRLNKVVCNIESKNVTDENILQSEESCKIDSKNPLTETCQSELSNAVKLQNCEVSGSDKIDLEEVASSQITIDSKRPSRNRNKPVFKYDDSGSEEEDPFANIELSDDEPNKKKKGKYNDDDDEYRPGKRQTKNSSDSDDFDHEDEARSRKRKFNIFDKSGKIRSPKKKRSQKINNTIEHKGESPGIIDIEDSLKSSVVLKTSQDGITDFLAKKIQGTDIKIFKTKPTVMSQTTFEIPVIDPNEPKKCVETSTQTNSIKIKSVGVQTDTQYEMGMMKQVTLSPVQAEKACEFLKNIVSTTAELGELMTQKSQEFIVKKINTNHVTDTLKMDYCVKKSFLLFKLAKHNLLQMEEDLEKQYEEFLKTNDLLQYREQKKEITPKPKEDSDCEIVEVPDSETITTNSKAKATFNPKTVFLNKELSIKIAKKTQEQPKKQKEKLNAKGKHTVWINDSIMVKKVKPTQSFLAQDSRNKKPPDYVTLEMVKKFFDNYNKEKILSICKKINSVEWLSYRQEIICNYFTKDANSFESTKMNEDVYSSISNYQIAMNDILTTESGLTKARGKIINPKSLLSICLKSFQNQPCKVNPKKLFTLCVEHFQKTPETLGPKSLFLLCVESFQKPSNRFNSKSILKLEKHNPKSLVAICIEVIQMKMLNENTSCVNEMNTFGMKQDNGSCSSMATILQKKEVKSLKFLCFRKLRKLMINYNPRNIEPMQGLKDVAFEDISPKSGVKCLSTLCFMKIQDHFLPDNVCNCVNSLSFRSLQVINQILTSHHDTIYSSQNVETREVDRTDETLVTLNEPVSLTMNNVNTQVTHTDLSCLKQHCLDSLKVDNNEDDSDDHDYSYLDYHSESNYADQPTEETSWVSKVQLQDLHSGAQSSFQSDDHEESNIDINDSNDCRLQQIKLEPLDVTETTTGLEGVKLELIDAPDKDEGIVPSTSFLTKEEYIEHLSEESRQQDTRAFLSTYDVDQFESFMQSNKMIKDINTNYFISQSDIFSQRSQRIRRQYDPDSDEENINSVDSMGLLVPQNIEQAKDDLLENSSDDDEKQTEKSVKKKTGCPKSGKKNTKEIATTKPKQFMGSDVEILTRKMRVRIRQEEKRHRNSNSDTDTPILTRKKRQFDLSEEAKRNKNTAENISKPSTSDALPDKEIQCNDVDSTETITADTSKKSRIAKKLQGNSEIIQENFPSELLECEPDISIGNNNIYSAKHIETNKNETHITYEELKYVERNGWKCYNIDSKDCKLYDEVSIVLQKLPESFIETYNRFQGINDKSFDDTEVDRLINLNSLHRNLSKDKDRGKIKEKRDLRRTNKVATHGDRNENNEESDNFAELTPSEDENEQTEGDLARTPDTDNSLAKALLLGDNDSDSEQVNKCNDRIGVKHEPGTLQETKTKSKSKSKFTKTADGSDVMLTADIMMNKELSLLHTPVALKEEEPPTDSKDIAKTRSSSRIGVKKLRQVADKDDDDSSSEEEKQWVSTKEKMLKRMEKKLEVTHEDEAKGAKRVSEFIEKCGDATEMRPRPIRGRGKRSRKKLLEKRKQLKVLAKELLIESGSGKRSSQNYGKGRRNIRKVIDKKSLQRDTVRANMQEFERKQRLAHRLLELRQRLGCEDGVNVVVINGELCLQYDFEKNAPVASVHPYFTSVMKAHQYEGVKFMWDACFETVEQVSSGHPGSGCILAHCMGLGKTLQVLALLHTVLTHPMLNVRRVLVCCPLSTVLNWVDEIHKWIGPVTNDIKLKKLRRKLQVFELSKLKKTYERAYQLEDWYSGGGIFIIGYELFRNLTTLDPDIDDVRPTIIKKIRTALLDPGPDVVICDEGHLLKNDSSMLAVAMSRVTTNRRIVLTGTPMQNNLREYYCMVNFVKPHLLGTYHEFSNRFENPIMNGQHRDSREEDIRLMKTRTHILHKVLEGCLQRQEASVLYPYLPKKYEYTVFIPLTSCQRDMYKHYLETYATKGKQMVLKDFHTLQKIWTHPQVLHNFQTKSRDEENKKIKAEKLEDDLAREDIAAPEDVKPAPTEVWWLQYLEGGDMLHSLRSSNKFQVVFHLLDECVALGDKVLIFSTSLFTMDTLEYFLRSIKQWSLGQDYYRLDGSVPAEVRQKWCREFNAPQNHMTKLFLISTRAGCLGLNMTAANRVIILDTSWNPAHDIQSIFRVYRFGQKKDCFIYRLVAMGTMEQKMYERSVTKQAVSCRVVDEQQIDRHYNSAELTELYSWDEEGWGVLAGVAPGVRDPALLRVAAAGALHAVREHDSLLRGSEPALPEDERAAAWQQFQLEHAEGHRAHVVTVDAAREADAKPSLGAGEALATAKAKRGRKKALDVPDEPAERDPPADDDAENDLVKKIMKILISNRCHGIVKLEELTALVVNIKKLVMSGMSGDASVDPVAASIATVILKDLRSSSTSTPADVAARVQAPEDSQTSPGVASVGSDSTCTKKKRTPRQAALRAERTFETIQDDPSNHAKDSEWDAKDKSKRKSKCKQNERETVPSDMSWSVESSIVISDDEVEATPVLEREKKKSYSNRNNRKSKEPDEVVPLHASLLTDDNFIKIVAHTYLKGNPMLAEDAALMAARYSTSKALKELQTSGKPITSGPIYDIAVTVLGTILLRKMHEPNAISSNKEIASAASSATSDAQGKVEAAKNVSFERDGVATAQISNNTQLIIEDDDDLQVVIPKEAVRKKKPFVGPKSRKLQMEKLQPEAKQSSVEKPTSPRLEANNVFPVGMFIGPGSPAKNSSHVEECILPDDDDDVIVAPIRQPSPTPKYPSQTAFQGPPIQPLTPARTSARKKDAPVTSSCIPNRAVGEKVVPLVGRTGSDPKGKTAKSVSGSSAAGSEPICLSDSDEEPVANPQQPAFSGTTPLLLQTATFTASNGSFVVPPAIEKMLDPTKKYYCIPSSSLPLLQSQNLILKDTNINSQSVTGINKIAIPSGNTYSVPNFGAYSAPVETNKPTKYQSPSIIITSSGQLQMHPTPPLPKAAQGTYPQTQSVAQGADKTVEGKANERKSNKKSRTVAAKKMETNRIQNSTVHSDIVIVDDDRDSPRYRTTRSRTPPDDDPMSIFKNVVHIQAPQSKIEEGINKWPVSQKCTKSNKLQTASVSQNPTGSLCSNYGKPQSNLTDSESSEFKRKRHKLELLKRLEKAKWANANFKTSLKMQQSTSHSSSASSSRKQTAAKAATNKEAAGSFIDLTEQLPTATPHLNIKRPSPWSKCDVKKPKKLQTLEDFDLDDLDDITELE